MREETAVHPAVKATYAAGFELDKQCFDFLDFQPCSALLTDVRKKQAVERHIRITICYNS